MSYILDALKKSEQQRQLGATPTLRSAQGLDLPQAPRRRWAYPALAVGLAATAFALGSLRPWQVGPGAAPAPRPAAQSEVAPQIAAAEEPSRPVAAPAPAAPAVLAAPAAEDTPPRREVQAAPAPDAARSASTEPTRAQPSQATAPAAARAPEARATKRVAASADARSGDKAGEDKVPGLADLPASLRAELPAMTVTVHAYSSAPGERLLGVNSKLLREGDALTPDLVLERITPDGMVFSYKGTKFQRGLR